MGVRREYGRCSYCGRLVVTYGDPEDRDLRCASRHRAEYDACRGRGSVTHRRGSKRDPNPGQQEGGGDGR